MITPEKSPQRHGLPTGSGSTKQIPAEVEHFELACVTLICGIGVAGTTCVVGETLMEGIGAGSCLSTAARPSPPNTSRDD